MEFKRVLIFVISLVSNEMSCITGIQVGGGHIQVFQKHPKLRECAGSILRKGLEGRGYYKEDYYVGGRISKWGAECEGLLRNILWDETVQSARGYMYFKFFGAKEVFNPPILTKDFKRTIPVVFRAGVKVTVTFREEGSTSMRVSLSGGYMVTYEESGFVLTKPDFQRIETQFVADTTKIFELSFWAETNAIEVYVNGDKIGTFPVHSQMSDVDTLTLSMDIDYDNRYIIHSFIVA